MASSIIKSQGPPSFWQNFVLSCLNFDRKRVSLETFAGSIRCIVLNPNDLLFVVKFFRDFSCCRFKNLCDVAGSDYPNRRDRFLII